MGANPKPAQVTLRGRAMNAKGGAVLLTDSREPIYIRGLDCWPEDMLGKEIIATGTLKEEKYLPDPVVDGDGAISQGAEGEQLVLEDARWEVSGE